MRFLFLKRIADLIPIAECKIKVIRPPGMTGDDFRRKLSALKRPFQVGKRLFGQFIVFRKGIDKAVAAVRAEPQGVAREQVFVVDQIDHMPPSMAGAKHTLDLDARDIKNLSVPDEHFPIIRYHQRQPVKPEKDFAPHLSR